MKYFPIPLVFTLIPTILTSLVAGKWSIGGLVDPPWTCDPKESTIMLMCIERARTWSLLFCPFMLFWSAHAMIDETATYCRARVRAVQPHVDLDELPCPRQSAERHRSLVMPGQRPLHPAGVRQRRKRGSCRCRARAMCGLRCQDFGGSSCGGGRVVVASSAHPRWCGPRTGGCSRPPRACFMLDQRVCLGGAQTACPQRTPILHTTLLYGLVPGQLVCRVGVQKLCSRADARRRREAGTNSCRV